MGSKSNNPTASKTRLKKKQYQSMVFRIYCREHLEIGWSVSKIAKQSGKSYAHAKQICAQITGEDNGY